MVFEMKLYFGWTAIDVMNGCIISVLWGKTDFKEILVSEVFLIISITIVV